MRRRAATPEEHKAIVRRLFQRQFVDADLGVVDETLDPDYIDHSPLPLSVPGREGYKRRVGAMRDAFSDIRFVVDDMLAEGDRVAFRFTFSGIHSGTFMNVSPTGRRVILTGINIERLSDGMVAEHWSAFDLSDVMRQLSAGETLRRERERHG